MTLSEKKVIVDYLKKGDEVSKILLADLAENEYPQKIHDLLHGVFEAIMQVEELEKHSLNIDAKNIMFEIECNYTLEEVQDYEFLEGQLSMMADESEDFKRRIFKIGVNAVLEEFYKAYSNK